MIYLIAYVATAIVFLGLDFIWLSQIAIGFYKSRIGALLMDEPNLGVSAIFYLFYVAGLVYLAVVPALNSGSWTTALVAGAVFGLVAYGTYDITNLATLKGWSVSVSVVDMIWGMCLSSVAATSGYFIASSLVRGV
ncbi:DUF2177 family protein [Mesorhizobium sp. NBSH29]|uniref:DUF2177 family protein n=1 Tax=Mesorhizobium sp. NBSH29 TaxID=2654249 RepID=UPI001896912C|nr:DUF2177 family protein [Mesorhizobium sp. NBSH29]QPC86790.1 DUF2177 family protein [Mesorhizobium sp. NBSH29]